MDFEAKQWVDDGGGYLRKNTFLIVELKLGFPVVITRNTFFHLRRSITRNYAFITFMKESLVSRN